MALLLAVQADAEVELAVIVHPSVALDSSSGNTTLVAGVVSLGAR